MANFSADAFPANPVLYEEGEWRIYGHFDDEYSTMAHKCPKWEQRNYPDKSRDPEWRWFWGTGDCQTCLASIPDDLKGLWTLHNFDRMSDYRK